MRHGESHRGVVEEGRSSAPGADLASPTGPGIFESWPLKTTTTECGGMSIAGKVKRSAVLAFEEPSVMV